MDRSAGTPRCPSPMPATNYLCATPRHEYAGLERKQPTHSTPSIKVDRAPIDAATGAARLRETARNRRESLGSFVSKNRASTRRERLFRVVRLPPPPPYIPPILAQRCSENCPVVPRRCHESAVENAQAPQKTPAASSRSCRCQSRCLLSTYALGRRACCTSRSMARGRGARRPLRERSACIRSSCSDRRVP